MNAFKFRIFLFLFTFALLTSSAKSILLKINLITTPNKRLMENKEYAITLMFDQSPQEVFKAINNVRGWWSEAIDGNTDKDGSEFNYHYKDVHICKMKIIEFVPNQKVTWLVLENYFNFTKDKTEWKNTKISFEISAKGGKTELVFKHIGLVPEYECYTICTGAWSNYINGSLRSLIETGKGKPNPYAPAIEEADKLKNTDK